jgi:SAM-dependent methyltransferase
VSRDGEAEQRLASAPDGECELIPVIVGSSYAVRLYAEGDPQPLLETVVTRKFWPRPREEGSGATSGIIDFGDLRRTTPISLEFGFERGQPIDRYYIEDFLARHAEDIRGRVLEVQDDSYATHFGRGRQDSVDILDYTDSNAAATLIGDLNQPGSLPVDTFDCVVFTQVLMHVTDPETAIRNIHHSLRENGVVLATFPGITQTTPETEGYFWRLTQASARLLFETSFPQEDFEVEARGNVLAAAAFLYGVASDELELDELEANDPRYEVSICVRAVKRTGLLPAAT